MDFLANLNQFQDWGLAVLRIAVGAIFWVHGAGKWKMWRAKPSEQMPSGMISTMKLLSVAEPLGAAAVILGFLTQFAALGLAIIMLGAIYLKTAKWKTPFFALDKNGWEFDLLILAANIALFFGGAGSISLDRALFQI